MKRLLVVLCFATSMVGCAGVSAAGFEDIRSNQEAKRVEKENERMREIQSLVGQTLYAYFPRQSCTGAYWVIKSRPSTFDTSVYTAASPQRVLIEELVQSKEDHLQQIYYRLRMQDGTIGYMIADDFEHRIGNPDSPSSLEDDCWFKLSPQELQAQQDKFEAERIAREKARAEEQRLALEAEKKKEDDANQVRLAKKAEQEANAPTALRRLPTNEFCVAYGDALRGEVIADINDYGEIPNIAKLVQSEARRRKLTFNDSATRQERIKLGMSECQLYAAWGYPSEQNRMTGRWGIDVQHVYGDGSYVYTENGRVTSWQN